MLADKNVFNPRMSPNTKIKQNFPLISIIPIEQAGEKLIKPQARATFSFTWHIFSDNIIVLYYMPYVPCSIMDCTRFNDV